MRWYLEAMKKYAVFSGRARRKEYWMFALMNLVIAFVLGIVEGILGIASDSDVATLIILFRAAVACCVDVGRFAAECVVD